MLAALAGLGSSWARAESRFSTLLVRSDVVPNCRVAVSSLSFGVYDPLVTHAGSTLDATAAVSVTCTKGITANVLMDDGSHGESGGRRMASGSESVGYQLYRDASRSLPWERGDAQVLRGEGVFVPTTLRVYGRVPSGQVVVAGAYSDTVTATVDF